MPKDNKPEPEQGAHVRGGTGLIAISRGGAQLAARLASALPGNPGLHVMDRFAEEISAHFSSPFDSFPLPLRPVVEQAFDSYSRLVLFTPVGVAVRLLAPLLRHKHRDPAVVCVDDAGRFVVSLVSGHVGGADELSQQVADILGATAVITSASHVKDTLAVDLLGREFGWQVDSDSATVTRVSAAVVNGELVGIVQEAGERNWWPGGRDLPHNVAELSGFSDLASFCCQAAILITDRAGESVAVAREAEDSLSEPIPLVLVRPRSLVVGMGCRRGVEREHLEELLVTTFREQGLSLKSVKCIATADIKSDEPGLLELAERYRVPLVCFGAEQLNSVFEGKAAEGSSEEPRTKGGVPSDMPRPSPAAHGLLGVWGVAEPAALLASGAERLLVSRRKTDRATISIARVPR